MKIEKTNIPDVYLIIPQIFEDNRGYFCESYSAEKLRECGINTVFVQDNHSLSRKKGTLRGIHVQTNPKAQTKLIRCTRGKILDVAVDLRKSSPTYKKYVMAELSAANLKQLYIPQGFGHAFLTLTDNCEVQYKVDVHYSRIHDISIMFNDPDFNIVWPKMNYILSDKDKRAPRFKELNLDFQVIK